MIDFADFDQTEVDSLEYIDVEYETTLDSDIFDRFLGVEIVQQEDGISTVKTGFPMPVRKPGKPLQRQNQPPKQVLNNYSGFDDAFQDKILAAKGW